MSNPIVTATPMTRAMTAMTVTQVSSKDEAWILQIAQIAVTGTENKVLNKNR